MTSAPRIRAPREEDAVHESAAAVRYDIAITGADVVLPPLGTRPLTVAITGEQIAACGVTRPIAARTPRPRGTSTTRTTTASSTRRWARSPRSRAPSRWCTPRTSMSSRACAVDTRRKAATASRRGPRHDPTSPRRRTSGARSTWASRPAAPCPQYLTHTKDAPEGNLAKVNPPLRETADQEALWKAIARGSIDTFGTDHCGVRRNVTGGDIWTAVPGFPGIATMIPVLLSEGVRTGRLTLADVAAVTSYRTARIFNLYPRKGTLLPGSDADLAIVDLELARKITPALLRSRSDFTLYDGRELVGWPVLTMVRGRVMMADGEIVGDPGHGRYQPRRAPSGGSTA